MCVVGKDWKTMQYGQNRPSKLFWANLGRKDGKSPEQPKLGVLNHFGPLWWEKMGKSVK